ncbi:sensor histidine kinase [Paenibacillus ferrarius]|uniref:sensor histidine kinase n=1 Tax=Paenibacillus ferrarius TaxID=1469647 RepID=UPI003D28C884
MSVKAFPFAGRLLIVAAILLFLLGGKRIFLGDALQISLHLLIWVSFTTVLFLPKAWRTLPRLTAAIALLLIESAVGYFWLRDTSFIYIGAIVLISTLLQVQMTRSAAPVILTLFVTGALYIRFGRADLFSALSFVLLAAAFYLSIRSRMQRNETNARNRQHLIDLQAAYAQLQEASVKDMHYAVLEERTRIARDIHDAVGHSLTSLIVQMQAMRYMLNRDPAKAAETLDSMLAVARQGLTDIRTSVHGLADDQSESGLLPVQALIARTSAAAGIRTELHAPICEDELDAVTSRLIFSVVQEALTNTVRHAEASEVQVRLEQHSNPNQWMLQIQDNGASEARHSFAEGFGLHMMRKRLEEHGGTLKYRVLEPVGFEVTAHIPFNEEDLPEDESINDNPSHARR